MTPVLLSGEAWTLALIFAALLVGTAIRGMARLRSRDEHAREHFASLLTWWVLATLLAAAILLGALGVCILLAAASVIGFREYARLAAMRPADRLAARAVLAGIPLLYLAILLGAGARAIAVLPVVALVLVVTAQLSRAQTAGYVRSTGGLLFGVLTVVYGLAHGALLATLPAAVEVPASDAAGSAALRIAADGGAGWFLYLVVLTQANDIAQALVGRRLGSRRITPRISPHKTWEGFIGGGVVTVLVALGLAPWLTPLDPLRAAFAGVVVFGAGFLGDINMSAVKRDAGVKDSSALLPGMGGMLDRVDSLTFTAPALYWLIAAPPW
ncbi:MAG TPA: phosphatidate cytidylyltransferase [Thermoanaerobaculia bacterium]|nr:phosphatidate cytidylyltransferase [Thermoanaerobaculia bacterium]